VTAKVCILILNWNNWQDTVGCLESVYQNSFTNCQAVVIDNGSSDNSLERVREWAVGRLPSGNAFTPYKSDNKPISHITYAREAAELGGDLGREKDLFASLPEDVSCPFVLIQTGANLGYAGGNNVGLRFAMKREDFSHVWILNNDTIIHQEALTELLACMESDDTVGAAGSKLLYHHEPDTLHMAGGCRIVPWMGNASMIGVGGKDDIRWDRPLEPDYISGASLLVKKKVLEDIGFMDERYFLYWEDADWGVRMRRRGYRLLYCPTSRVWHKEGGTAGRLSPVSDYYWVRNGLFFMKKFYPALLPLAPVFYLLKYTLVRLVKGQPLHFSSFLAGVRDFLKGRTGSRELARKGK